ncbi:MAG: serine/threonine-protein kinase [Myxococcaceae bacterium]|nr:serine/threonine-protein kinase [Myxococcaceae bacterium]
MPERFGQYELLRRLGHGGMGEVFLARAVTEALAPERLVVIKRTLPHLAADPALVTRFLHEARAAAHVHHPNVAEVFELGSEGGRLFLVMAYVEGLDLATLSRGEPLDPVLSCQVLADAARGLDAAHRTCDHTGRPLELAHGDVTPKNLIVGTDGVTRVIDFGLSVVRATRTDGSHGGTYEYQAPEQALEGLVDAKTDQFALGVVAWELLGGRRLFAGETDVSTLDEVVACRVPSLGAVWPEAPRALIDVVDRMLAKDPAARWPTCQDVAEAFDAFLAEHRATRSEARGQAAAHAEGLVSRGDEHIDPRSARLEAGAAESARSRLAQRVVGRRPVDEPLAPVRIPTVEPRRANLAVVRPMSGAEPVALEVLRGLSGALTLDRMEQELTRAGLAAPLDLLQGLLEAGALWRVDDETFELSVRP